MEPALFRIKPIRKLVAILMALALLIPNTSVQRAYGEVDGAVITGLSMATMAFAMTNTVSSVKHCVCMPSCASYPWATCGMLALTVGTLVASIVQSGANEDSVEHFDPETTLGTATGADGGGAGGGIGGALGTTSGGAAKLATTAGTTLPGTKRTAAMDWGAFCSKSAEFCDDCAKGGDFTKCQPKLQLPADFPAEAAAQMPELAEALAAIETALNYVNENGNPSLAAIGATEAGFPAAGAGSVDPAYVKKGKNALGKSDGEGLGNVSIWGMDVVDESTGAKLTLWQRGTRRYYGAPDLKRLEFLARAEFVRSKAIQHAKANIASPELPRVAQQKTQAIPPQPARTPASLGHSPGNVAPKAATTKY